MRPGLVFATIVILVMGGALVLRVLDPAPVARLRSLVFDTYQQIEPRIYDPDQPVRIVDIDEESLRRIGQWPWPRSVLAELVKKLQENGVAAVGFDLVFSEPDRLSPDKILAALPKGFGGATLQLELAKLPSSDQAFADAIATAPVVLGFVAVPEAGVGPPATEKAGFAFAGDDPREFLVPFGGLTQSLPVLAEKAVGSGSLNWIPEHDQVVRRVPLLVRVGDTVQPSFALELLRVAFGAPSYLVRSSGASGEESFGERTGIVDIRIGDLLVPSSDDGQLWMRFTASDKRRFIPFWKVLDGQVPAAEIEGRIILVGTSAAGLLDLRSTPLEQAAPGVEMHAQAIEQILSNTHLYRPDFILAVEFLYLLGVGSLVAALVYFSGAAWGALLGAVTLVGVGFSSWLAYTKLGWLVDPVYPSLAVTALYIAGTIYLYLKTEGERRRVRSAFSHYMAPALVAKLAADPGKLVLGGEKRDMTLVFADVRGFTSISEGLDAQELTRFINRLMTPLSNAILAEKGTIDKYMGDAVMAFWNAPLDDPEHARNACRAALMMLDELDTLNAALAGESKAAGREPKPVRLGIGINTGLCCVGNFGSEQRFDYSVVGDNVNIASRLEGLTKDYGTPIIVGEATAVAAHEFALLEVDSLAVRGKQEETRIYALIGNAAVKASAEFVALKNAREAVVVAWRAGDFAAAAALATAARDSTLARARGIFELYLQRLDHKENAPGRMAA